MTNKKAIFLVLVFFFFFIQTVNLYSENLTSLVFRAQEYDQYIRIVFESTDDAFLNNIKISKAYSLVRVVFPSDFTLVKSSVAQNIKWSKKDNTMFFTIKNLEDVKTLSLTSPSRIVIDAYYAKDKDEPAITEDQKKWFKKKNYKVLIDSGHGGSEMGILMGETSESLIVQSIAEKLQDELKEMKVQVDIIRKEDNFISIESRMKEIENYKPDIFLSIHLSNSKQLNIYTATEIRQSLTLDKLLESDYGQLKYLNESKRLSKEIGDSLLLNLNIKALSGALPLPILFAAQAPAVMIELPKSNYNDETIIKLVKTIFEGINNFAQK
ncbi:secreted protein containing Cell wall hydrolase/autolysin, catalytic domain protein [Candidatus Magnetoovum chiemensis]|nr:secreted protein containing Cell wall hydrolase/autolysin, catalytic domain protein [Candidatus Magnetoovum chiemensis]